MTELLTAAQMRAIEQAAIDAGDVTGVELMERAGRGIVEAIFEEWPEYRTAPQSIAILCGPGNNGGDGFVVARLLYGKGWTVSVFLYGDPDKLPPDARTNYEIWLADGEVEDLTERAFRKTPHTLYLDAIFGTGLTRPLEGEAFAVMRHMSGINGDDYSKNTVAVDAPSGLCLDSGRVLAKEPQGPRPFSDKLALLTVTFDSPKVGHFLNTGPDVCGKLVVKDIGLENWRCFKKTLPDKPAFKVGEHGASGAIRPAKLNLLTDKPLVPDIRKKHFQNPAIWRLGRFVGDHNKYTYGHAFVLTGGSDKTGAARLAARGALRVGAGLVTLGVPGAAQMEVACQVTSIMLKRAGREEEVASALEDTRINAVCLGPGLGLHRARGLVETVLGGAKPRPTVLDADALSVFEEEPEALFEMVHEGCMLTPHGGEFARLFPDIAKRLNEVPTKGPAYSKVDATREAAERARCVVLFKGPDTVIATPNGRCSINSSRYDRAAPWLATAGSGDVLAGFITGLLARGFDPFQAAETAAWLHVECARAFGPGLIAEDLPEVVPRVLRELGA
ncbi:MAG: NAD(P)H-hydrate dehydratase [Pseudomonadota bacterium]